MLIVDVIVSTIVKVELIVDIALDVELEIVEIVQLASTVAPSKAYAIIAVSLICLAG